MWIREKKDIYSGSVSGTKAQVVDEIVKLLDGIYYELPSTSGSRQIIFSHGKAYFLDEEDRKSNMTIIAGPNSTYPREQKEILVISIPVSDDAKTMHRIYQNMLVNLMNAKTTIKALSELKARCEAIEDIISEHVLIFYLERNFCKKVHQTGAIWRESSHSLNMTTLINNKDSKLNNIIYSDFWTDEDRMGFHILYEK